MHSKPKTEHEDSRALVEGVIKINRAIWIALLTLTVVATAGCKNETRESQPINGQQKGATIMSAKKATVDIGKYGFRYDPMKWITESKSVPAAQVRTFLLKTPADDDKAILQAEIDRLLSDQRDDGSLGEEETVGRLIRLSRLGCSPDRREVQRAVAFICRGKKVVDRGHLGSYQLHVATWAKWPDKKLISHSTEQLAKEVAAMNFWSLCPWGGQVHTHGMWAGREYADITSALDRGMRVMLDGIQEGSGWPVYLDPFGFLDAAGNIDHPLARQIVIKQIALLLRTQQADGTWGGMKHLGYGPDDTTYVVLRALIKWDLLEPLRQLPPLPPDWRIVRRIPAPRGDLSMLTWDGERLWVYDKATGSAVGISPEDGAEVNRVSLPGSVAKLGPVNGRRVAVRVKTLEGGKEGETTWVLDPNGTKPLGPDPTAKWVGLAGTWSIHDFWGGPPILQKRPKHPLKPDIDSGEAPFQQHTTGVAWDGKNLWALDNRGKQICIIERNRPPETK